jgi:hypothetical protein
MKPWRLSIMEGSILKYRLTPIWRTTFAKPYGISEVILEHIGEHHGNLGNMLGI